MQVIVMGYLGLCMLVNLSWNWGLYLVAIIICLFLGLLLFNLGANGLTFGDLTLNQPHNQIQTLDLGVWRFDK